MKTEEKKLAVIKNISKKRKRKYIYFFLQKSYFYLNRVQKNFDQKFFFYKGDPPKNGNFSKIFFLHLLILKIFTLSKFHSPMCRNGRNFTKKTKKRQKNRTISVTRGKSANFEKRFSLFFKLVQFWLKFQISGSSDV